MESEPAEKGDPPKRLPFPPLTRSHILHCSYHYWHPLYVPRRIFFFFAASWLTVFRRYRAITPKARLIPLNEPFLSYLRSDGIVLPPEGNNRAALAEDDSGVYSFSDSDTEEQPDPSVEWHEIHTQIKETIAELGGRVVPKLNWSAPKDATWISATNDMQCRTANDIYLLLKSSDFVTHDLQHALDDCESEAEATTTTEPSSKTLDTQNIPYHLVLRKYFNLNPSLEFRCFVRNRILLCMCQRDLNHFDFLFPMRDSLRARIQSFFDEKLKDTFPDPNFVFDVYIPPPHERVWLIDINPWAIRTDPLLFSWMEILNMKDPTGVKEEESLEEDVVRLSFNNNNEGSHSHPDSLESSTEGKKKEEEEEKKEPSSDETGPSLPELRLVERDDPEAYAFTTPQFSAHKLPKEVVDASRAGPGGMKDFMGKWQDILEKRFQEEKEEGSSDEE